MALPYKYMESPLGRLKLIANDTALLAICWEREERDRLKLDHQRFDPEQPILLAAERQLIEYFASARTTFNLPIEPAGTDFQKRVWLALGEIPFGETRSYRDLARAVASVKFTRAVGQANARNPLAIVVPCHRVIGSDGSLTGFAGGLEIKAALLSFEARTKIAMTSN